MGGKAKPTKHTAKELAKKAADALTNKGGGSSGKADRAGGAAGHAKFQCYVCMQNAPDLKSLTQHFENKHAKMTFDESKVVNKHAGGVATTKGVAIRGGIKKHHN